jgi:hypothetical protein
MLKELTFNQWQDHLSNELDLAYKKLKLRKDENVQTVQSGKSTDLSGVRKDSISINKKRI